MPTNGTVNWLAAPVTQTTPIAVPLGKIGIATLIIIILKKSSMINLFFIKNKPITVIWTIILLSSTMLWSQSTIPLNQPVDFKQAKDITMTSLFSEIKYVTLETSEQSLIGEHFKFSILNNKIYVIENEKVLRFDINGKFETIIIKNGRGPNELIGPIDLSVNKDHIYVLGFYEVAKLKLDGELISKFKVPIYSESIHCLADNNVLIYYGQTMAEEGTFKFGLYNENGRLLKSFLPSPYSVFKPGSGNHIHPNKNNVFLTMQDNDTIFEFINDQIRPNLAFDFGKQNRYTVLEKYKYKMKTPIINNLYPTDDLLFINMLYFPTPGQPISYKAVYSILKKNLIISENNFINDIDYGLDFFPFQFIRGNLYESLFMVLYPFDIMRRANEIRDNRNIPESKNAFLEISKKINENSNPVIMIAKLKGK